MPEDLCQDIQANLLEANVHVKRKWLSWVADRRDTELPIGCCTAGDQLYCIGPRVVSHLDVTQKHGNNAKTVYEIYNHFTTAGKL